MTTSEKAEFESLLTPRVRATWLLNKGLIAKPDIDSTDLTLIWRVYASDVMLPGKYTGTEAEAIRQATAWLRYKAENG